MSYWNLKKVQNMKARLEIPCWFCCVQLVSVVQQNEVLLVVQCFAVLCGVMHSCV